MKVDATNALPLINVFLLLRSVRILLKNHAAEWDGLNQIDRLKILQPYLPDVDETSAKSKPFKEEKKWWRRSQAGQ